VIKGRVSSVSCPDVSIGRGSEFQARGPAVDNYFSLRHTRVFDVTRTHSCSAHLLRK